MIADYQRERLKFSLVKTRSRLRYELSEIERNIDNFEAVTQNVLRGQIAQLEEEIDCLYLVKQYL